MVPLPCFQSDTNIKRLVARARSSEPQWAFSVEHLRYRPASDGPGAQRAAEEAPTGTVRPTAGQRDYRSVSVPRGHFNGRADGGHRVSADQQTEDSEAVGAAARPRTPGLPRLPAGPGGLQLGPRPAAAGARDRTRARLERRGTIGSAFFEFIKLISERSWDVLELYFKK